MVGLVDVLLAKQGVVGVAVGRALAQQHQACGFAVDAVQWHQVVTTRQVFQLHEQTLLHIPPTRCDGHEMGLVGH